MAAPETATSETESKTKVAKDTASADESEDDECEILEESPCGRWLKRREEVQQRDVPGIDVAYLAMDTEEGVEVVWNEVKFSERKNFKEEKIKHVFDNLTQLEHPNIVKFHKYWCDRETDNPRVVFITEYMSSGSLKSFLQKTKKNNKTINPKSWKRWCTQILSALSYLHSCDPPIIHGNLSCDTIFIQHNGLIKIGSVAPDAIHQHVKTCRHEKKNMYYIAPEYGAGEDCTTAVDIYAFGICVLEMATLGNISGNGEGIAVTDEAIHKAIDLLDDSLQKDFILKCIEKDPKKRPNTRRLLLHKVLFEVHSLRLLAAHVLVNNSSLLDNISEESYKERVEGEFAFVPARDGTQLTYKYSELSLREKLEKFLEDVKCGIYPLTAFEIPGIKLRPRAVSPEVAESVKSNTPEPLDVEIRKVMTMQCSVKPDEEGEGIQMTLLLRMEDKMNRHLSCKVLDQDNSTDLAHELVHYAFINEADKDRVASFIDEHLRSLRNQMAPDSTAPAMVNGFQVVLQTPSVSS